LDGALPEAVTATDAPAAGVAARSGDGSMGAADPANGVRLYAESCGECHGADGRGGPGGGPSLEQSTDFATVTRIVRDGLTHMPAFGASLNVEHIRDISAHVTQRLSSAAEP
jgi:mono/diheme cytochrome c family protein